jgi:hypothetical protein
MLHMYSACIKSVRLYASAWIGTVHAHIEGLHLHASIPSSACLWMSCTRMYCNYACTCRYWRPAFACKYPKLGMPVNECVTVCTRMYCNYACTCAFWRPAFTCKYPKLSMSVNECVTVCTCMYCNYACTCTYGRPAFTCKYPKLGMFCMWLHVSRAERAYAFVGSCRGMMVYLHSSLLKMCVCSNWPVCVNSGAKGTSRNKGGKS